MEIEFLIFGLDLNEKLITVYAWPLEVKDGNFTTLVEDEQTKMER